MLTEIEKNMICLIATDLQTGNHLLNRRPPSYYRMSVEVYTAINTVPKPAEGRLSEILEYFNQVSDYDYYNSLPLAKRLF